MVVSGWGDTVGVVGWGIGGGRGPFTPSLGLGVDNILEVEIIIANGTLLVSNSQNNSDIYWAVRGGGASAWGIITSITYRAHAIPDGGFTEAILFWNGTYCEDSFKNMTDLLQYYLNWTLKADKNWVSLGKLTPSISGNASQCNATWELYVYMVFMGGKSDSRFVEVITNFT